MIWWINYVILLKSYRIFYYLFESVVNRNEWKHDNLSWEFRSHYCFVAIPHLYRWTLKLWLKCQHLIPDIVVILFGRYVSSYNMGSFTTIPLTANIKSIFISKRTLNSQISTINSSLSQSQFQQALKTANIDDENIKNINLLWVTGNDQIQKMSFKQVVLS